MRNASELSGVGQLLKQGIFAIPAYQRDYAWPTKDVDTLLDDVFDIAQTNNQHYLGSIVVMKAENAFKATSAQGDFSNIQNSGELTVYHIVDGQQRLTCCSLILCALAEIIREEPEDNFPQQAGPYSKTNLIVSVEDFIIDRQSYLGDNFAPRLFLNNDPSKQYQSCLPGFVSIASNGRRLKNAFKRIKQRLQDHRQATNLDAPNYFVAIRNAVTSSLKVDDVCCNDFGSAFQIFESINAKGQPLASADLIKCFLVQKASGINTSDAERKWNKLLETVGASSDKMNDLDRFMGIFLFTEKGERVSKARAYDVFKDLYGNVDYLTAFERLQKAADIYKTIAIENQNDRWKDDNPLKTFKVLKLTSIYVPLLAAARYYEGGMANADYKELEKKLSPFAIRYQVCGKTSNALDKPFERMIQRIKAGEHAGRVMEELREIIPSNDAFRTAFGELTIKDSEESLATHLLVGLEAFIELKDHQSTKQLPPDYTLEHIIPKEYSEFVAEWDFVEPENFKEEIVRSIGNLALIGKADNSSASNQPYSKKLPIYESGSSSSEASPTRSYNLLKAVVEKYPCSFTVESVKERASELADKAVVCWEV